MKILITAGGTEEPIDSVRFISNFSSGATGVFLGEAFVSNGWDVHIHHSKRAAVPMAKANLSLSQFTTFRDLDLSLKALLSDQKFDVVIHAAAVSDFSVSRIEQSGMSMAPLTDMKLSSDEPITLKLIPNFKILDRIKSYSKLGVPRLVAFKLTSTSVPSERVDAAFKLFASDQVDFVVQNDLSEIDPKSNIHKGNIFKKSELLRRFNTKEELAGELIKILKEHI